MATNLGTKVTATLQGHLSENFVGAAAGFLPLLLTTCQGAPPTTANMFVHGCLMVQTDTATGSNAVYQNTGSFAVPVWTLLDTALGGPATSLVDTNSVTALDVGTTTSAVNNLRVTNSATGAVTVNAVTLSAVGTDAAVSINVVPKGVTGIFTLGLSNGTGDIVLGQSTATQAVRIGHGVGASTVSIANQSVAGALVNVAGAVTGAGITDTINIATGNAAATGFKLVNIGTGSPVTPGNNRITIGGGTQTSVTLNSTLTSYQAINRCVGSAVANAPVATLNNAAGIVIGVNAGLRILLTLAATLQAGANTLNLNGAGAIAIKSHLNVANNIATAYAATGIIDLLYDGTQWLDMSQ